MKRILFCLIIFPFFIHALEKQPWFGNVYEFTWLNRYSYDWYRRVNSAIEQPTKTSKDHLWQSALELPISENWDVDADLEFAKTPRQNFSFRSTAMQMRYLFLNDIKGDDPVSLDAGVSIRYTGKKSLRDVSCPYHRNMDVELQGSIGHEYAPPTEQGTWFTRTWLNGGFGIDNKADVWVNGSVNFGVTKKEIHFLYVFLSAEQTYGKKKPIDINHFYGYGDIWSTYMDMTVMYAYNLGIWGYLKLDYTRRLLAKNRPVNVNTCAISYQFSFSF